MEVSSGCTTTIGTVGTRAPLAVTTRSIGNSAMTSRLASAREDTIQVV